MEAHVTTWYCGSGEEYDLLTESARVRRYIYAQKALKWLNSGVDVTVGVHKLIFNASQHLYLSHCNLMQFSLLYRHGC